MLRGRKGGLWLSAYFPLATMIVDQQNGSRSFINGKYNRRSTTYGLGKWESRAQKEKGSEQRNRKTVEDEVWIEVRWINKFHESSAALDVRMPRDSKWKKELPRY